MHKFHTAQLNRERALRMTKQDLTSIDVHDPATIISSRWYRSIYLGFLKGFKRGHRHAQKSFRKELERQHRARNRTLMVNCKDWDDLALEDFPDRADWLWF